MPNGNVEVMILGQNLDTLVERVAAYMRLNTIEEPEDLRAWVEHNLCLLNPNDVCVGNGPKRFFPTSRQIESGTKALLAMARKEHGILTSQKRADERAAICIGCDQNENLWSCFLCTGLAKLARQVYQRGTVHDEHLRACKVCGCVNQAQVHLSAEATRRFADKKVDAADYPDWCWKRKVLEGDDDA